MNKSLIPSASLGGAEESDGTGSDSGEDKEETSLVSEETTAMHKAPRASLTVVRHSSR